MDILEPAQFVSDHRVHRSFFLIGVVLLTYDHLLTLRAEVKYIWASSLRMSTFWFLLVRYTGLLASFAVVAFYLGDLGHEVCVRMQLVWEVLLVIQELLVEITLIVRVFAMYGLNFWILGFLLSIGSVSGALALWAIIEYGRPVVISPPLGVPALHGCHVAFTRQTALRLAGAWEGLLVCDTVVFLLTVRRVYIQRPVTLRVRLPLRMASRQHNAELDRPETLLERMYKDGALYFGIIVLANLANLLTFYLGDMLLAGSLSWFTTNISVALLCRLMLSLHQAGNAGLMSDVSQPSGLETQTLRFGAPAEDHMRGDG
ncbi:hypothetical protein MIND_00392600 [Mycena indigotica]|uniref:DUF6533 domain-containing protein n=1 Tax=Mycena indigotica TaxID=2126181 RepID=A0A8H6T1B5_9AGAR|nr:uncharacterized protein MIND_00392600 [Mycena indigotica]KAF7310190.1 hypothetical protein MIND_00392600 [Mycena indigotica]